MFSFSFVAIGIAFSLPNSMRRAKDNGIVPLKRVKIIEVASIGPGLFCAMMLADMGAEIIRIDRQKKSLSDSQYL